jgi:hypothetical protein
MADRPDIRASDADREHAIALLRDGAADGRLTVEELTSRIDAASAAQTLDELDAVTADLGRPLAPADPAGGRRRTAWLVALMGGSSRSGRWRVAPRLRAIAVMGGVEIDLCQAELAGEEVTITAVALMGGVDVRVPEGVEVELEGFVLMGGRDARLAGGPPRPGAPRVRVRAFGVMGSVTVATPRRRQPLPPPDF